MAEAVFIQVDDYDLQAKPTSDFSRIKVPQVAAMGSVQVVCKIFTYVEESL